MYVLKPKINGCLFYRAPTPTQKYALLIWVFKVKYRTEIKKISMLHIFNYQTPKLVQHMFFLKIGITLLPFPPLPIAHCFGVTTVHKSSRIWTFPRSLYTLEYSCYIYLPGTLSNIFILWLHVELRPLSFRPLFLPFYISTALLYLKLKVQL